MSSPVKPTFEAQYHSWPLSVAQMLCREPVVGQGLGQSQSCSGSLPGSQPQVLDGGSEADPEAGGPPRRLNMGGGQAGIPQEQPWGSP